MKPLTAISQKFNEFIRSLERSRRRATFIEGLRKQGWKGTDSEIIRDHTWISLPAGATETPDEDDLEIDINEEDFGDEEERENTPVKIDKGW